MFQLSPGSMGFNNLPACENVLSTLKTETVRMYNELGYILGFDHWLTAVMGILSFLLMLVGLISTVWAD